MPARPVLGQDGQPARNCCVGEISHFYTTHLNGLNKSLQIVSLPLVDMFKIFLTKLIPWPGVTVWQPASKPTVNSHYLAGKHRKAPLQVASSSCGGLQKKSPLCPNVIIVDNQTHNGRMEERRTYEGWTDE